jgi:DNA-binding IclR family transcriptional regulator
MADSETPPEIEALVEKMRETYVDSEFEIAQALADRDGALSVEELAETTGYTERTVEKRVESLIDQLGGEPLAGRDEEGRPRLHPELAAAIRSE